jgi:ATP-dependent Clp protease ATP-binding subunit ClpA
MFERFTEESVRALFFAEATAQQAGRDFVEPEHILAGVLRAAPAILSSQPDPASMYHSILHLLQLRPFSETVEPATQKIPFSPAVQRLLNDTVAEADRLRHHRIRPEHILIALLGHQGSVPAQALRQAGVEREALAESASRAAAVTDGPLPYRAYLRLG